MNEYNIIFFCKDCGCFFFICSKKPEVLKDSATEIRKYLRQGHRMEEISTDNFQNLNMDFCKCRVKPKKKRENSYERD